MFPVCVLGSAVDYILEQCAVCYLVVVSLAFVGWKTLASTLLAAVSLTALAICSDTSGWESGVMQRQLQLTFLWRWWQSFHWVCSVQQVAWWSSVWMSVYVLLLASVVAFQNITFALRREGAVGKNFGCSSCFLGWTSISDLIFELFQSLSLHLRLVIKSTEFKRAITVNLSCSTLCLVSNNWIIQDREDFPGQSQ